jgi:hypothetical protein
VASDGAVLRNEKSIRTDGVLVVSWAATVSEQTARSRRRPQPPITRTHRERS